MKVSLFERIYKYSHLLLSIVFALFILRPMLPQYIKYLLFPLIFIIGSILLIRIIRGEILVDISKRKKIKFFYPVIFLFFFYVIAAILFSESNIDLYKELLNNFFVMIFFTYLYINTLQLNEFEILINRTKIIVTTFGVSLAIFGIYKLIMLFYGVRFSFLYAQQQAYPLGTSLSVDSNFFALSCFIGFLFFIYFLLKTNSRISIFCYQISSIFLIIAIFLSSSRRALAVVGIITMCFVLLWLSSFFSKKSVLVKFRKNFRFIFFFILASFTSFYLFFVAIDSNKRDKIILKLSMNKADVVGSFAKNLNFISRLFEDDNLKSDFWSSKIDPMNPNSGWARANYEEVKVISGRSSEIVPSGSIGAKISKGIDSYYLDNGVIYYSPIAEKVVSKEKKYLASLYCYVSEDFDGDQVYLSYEVGSNHLQYSYYNMLKKGSWQKLRFLVAYKEGKVNSTFYVTKKGVKDFNDLKGSVIFAHPSFDTVLFNPCVPETWMTNQFYDTSLSLVDNSISFENLCSGAIINNNLVTSKWSNNSIHSTLLYKNLSSNKIRISINCFLTNEFNGDAVYMAITSTDKFYKTSLYDTSKKGTWQRMTLEFMSDSIINSVYFYVVKKNCNDFRDLKGHVIIAYPEISVFSLEKDSIKSESLSNSKKQFEASFISLKVLFHSDTLRSPEFTFSNLNDGFIDSRLDRWRYAIHLYRYEYKYWQKIIGGGFDYTQKFAQTFNSPTDKYEYDYPHNQFLSVLLYSGIIGLAVYIWFLVKAVYYYWIYRKEYWTLGLAFGVTFFFAFFSSNSPFDPAILGIFSILPYFIHYYNLKDQQSANE